MDELKNKKILVVDDDAQLVDMISEFLTKKGYKISTALDSDEVIKVLDAEPMDIILLDIMMPKINGEQLFTMIREMIIILG